MKLLINSDNILSKKISWKVVIVATIIFMLFIIVILPQISTYSEKVIGVSNSPDMSFIYTADDIYDMAESYGETGRNTYIFLRWTFDIAWPLVYGFFLISLAGKLSFVISDKKWINKLYMIPLFAVVFDYLENIGTTIVMARYPMKTNFIASITPILSLIKWLLLSGGFLLVIILLVIIIIKRFGE